MDGAFCTLVRGILLLALWSVSLTASARAVLDLDAGLQSVPLADWGDYVVETSAAAEIQQIAERTAGWAPTLVDTPYRLAPGEVLWIRFTIPATEEKYRWYVEAPSSSVERMTLYWRDATHRWTSLSAGAAVPVADWPLPHRRPLLPVGVSAETHRTYFLRIDNAGLLPAPLQFVNEGQASERDQRVSLGLGFYFGLAGLAALTAALAALQMRDAVHARWAIAIALMGLTEAWRSGVAGLHLWPRTPSWNEAASIVLPILATMSAAWAHMGLVSIGERSTRIQRWMQSGIALALPLAGATWLAPAHQRALLLAPYVAAMAGAMLAAIVWAGRRGDIHARWLLASTIPVLAGAAVLLARSLGANVPPVWAEHALQVGTALQWPIVLMILMVRSQLRFENRRRLRRATRADPVTGLCNEHEFRQRLARMVARSQRMKYRSSVLLVDIVNLERLRRDYGSALMPEIPVRVAGRLLSIARDVDSVARLSEHRFGMLVEGPLDEEEAKQLGVRVVARCLMPVRNKPEGWVPRVHVAQAIVPRAGSEALDVIAALEDLLCSVSLDGRRAVFHLPA